MKGRLYQLSRSRRHHLVLCPRWERKCFLLDLCAGRAVAADLVAQVATLPLMCRSKDGLR